MLAIKIPSGMDEELASAAKKAGRKVDKYALDILIEHLEDLEDLQAIEGALKEGLDTVSLEDHLQQQGLTSDDLNETVLDGVDIR